MVGQGSTSGAVPGVTAVDTRMAGRTQITSAYLLAADEPALLETGPSTSTEAVVAGLAAIGIGPADLAHVIVTHIHLDHAGGLGHVARRFPNATVWVHERGAPHVADPTRLVQSAARVFGQERLDALFGPVDPVPQERIRALSEGDRVDLGNRRLDVLDTPGHASHHVALVDSDTGAGFVGDALGIHLPEVRVLRPATPPPDIDIELGVNSIERIRQRSSILMFSHFGPVGEVDALCEVAAARLRRWADIVRGAMDDTEDLEQITAILRTATAEEFDEAGSNEGLDRYEILSSMEMNASGLVRYWRKKADAQADAVAAEGG